MAQVKTTRFSAQPAPSTTRKLVHAAYFLKSNISKAVSAMKEKVSSWSSRASAPSPNSISIQDALDRNPIKYGYATGFDRILPLK